MDHETLSLCARHVERLPPPTTRSSVASFFGNESQTRAPRVSQNPFAIPLFHGVTSFLHVARRVLGVLLRRDDDLPLEQTRIRVRRGRRAASPGVGAEVMMISARRHEQRAGIAPHDLVESE